MKKCLIIALLLIFGLSSSAKEIGGKKLPDNLTINNANLILNGAGVIKKFFFKVYAIGLYLDKKSKDPKQILSDDKTMAIRMHFIRDGINRDKIVDAWQDGFEKNSKQLQDKLKSRFDKFCSFFSDEVKENDIFQFEYLPGTGTKILINGQQKGIIEGNDFKKMLFGIWLGEDPRDDDVKDEMLGID